MKMPFAGPEKGFLLLMLVSLLVTAAGCQTGPMTPRQRAVLELSVQCYQMNISHEGSCPLFMSDHCTTVRIECHRWAKDIIEERCGVVC